MRRTMGGVLPQVQRQHAWEEADKSEGYVCLSLDSLLKDYPIRGAELREADKKVPYRRFAGNYRTDFPSGG